MPHEWSDPGHVRDYLRRELPYRLTAEGMLLDVLPHTVDRVLDLGTGDGRLIELVRSAHPDCYAVGLDSSRPMLARARERFDGDDGITILAHDLAGPLPEAHPYNAVVSALAIHHLEDRRKRTLFAEVHGLLRPGGVFVNLDLVRAPTPDLHQRFRRAVARPRDDPSDHLAPLEQQLDWLRDGFAVVDCPFKWMQMALMVAVR